MSIHFSHLYISKTMLYNNHMMLNQDDWFTKSDALAVCLKLLGISYFLTMLMYIPLFCVSLGYAKGNYWEMAGMILGFVLYIGIAYVLLEYGDRIAYSFISEKDDKKLSIAILPETVPSIARLIIRIIGLWCMIKGIPDFAGIGADIAYRYYWDMLGSVDPFRSELFFSSCISLIIGIYLIVSPNKIAGFLLKLKKNSVSKEVESAVTQDNHNDQT